MILAVQAVGLCLLQILIGGQWRPWLLAAGAVFYIGYTIHLYVSGQDAEKVRQRRSRIAQRLNVPKRTPRLFARCGLAGQPF